MNPRRNARARQEKHGRRDRIQHRFRVDAPEIEPSSGCSAIHSAPTDAAHGTPGSSSRRKKNTSSVVIAANSALRSLISCSWTSVSRPPRK